MAFDYTIDYAKRAIDLAKAGAADHLIVQALADREKKITDLGLTEKQAGSSSALRDYLSIITGGSKGNVAAAPQDLGQNKTVEGIVEVSSDPLFNPNDFLIGGASATVAQTSYSAAGGTGSKIAGYIIVGLVGIVILDKLLG